VTRFLVAATRWDAPLDAVLAQLAPVLGLGEYDARLRLAGPVPVVVAAGIAEPDARELLRWLRDRGHGAVACAEDNLPTPARVLTPRGFEFTADAFVALDARAQRYVLPYGDILAIVRARWIRDTQTTTATVDRQFSLRRMMMTGGIAPHRDIERVERATASERDEVLYLFRGAGPDPMALRAGALLYDGLGAHKGATARTSFGTLVEWLRQRAPGAVHDERLLAERRRPTVRGASGAGQFVMETSNEEAAVVAAFLLVHAHLQRQL
jgi:hypothetical protein